MYSDPLSNLFEIAGLESRVLYGISLPGTYGVVLPAFARHERRGYLARSPGLVDDDAVTDPELYGRACELIAGRQLVSVELLRLELGLGKYTDAVRLADELEREGALGPADPQLRSFCLVTRGKLGMQLPGRPPVELGPHALAVFPGTSALLLRDPQRRGKIERIANLRDRISGYPPRLNLCADDGAPSCEGLIGWFRFRAHVFNPLASALAEPLVVSAGRSSDAGDDEDRSSRVAWILADLERRLHDRGALLPGTHAAVERMLETLLIEALDADARRREDPCWIRALADPGIGGALRHIHSKPGHPWTNTVLGRRSGLRQGFERQFERQVGCKPQVYLSRWRMELAARALADVPEPSAVMLETLAGRLGFGSGDQLSQEFARQVGVSPQKWSALVSS